MHSLLPPANEVCEGHVFTGVCLSTGGVCPIACWDTLTPGPEQTHPRHQRQTPPWDWGRPPRTRHPPGTRGRHLPWNQRQTPPPGTRGRHLPLGPEADTLPGPEADTPSGTEQTPLGPDTPPDQRQTPPPPKPEADTPQSRDPPGTKGRHPPGPDIPLGSEADILRTRDRPPGPDTPPQCSACWEIRATSVRYASYWNAQLLIFVSEYIFS